MVGHIVYGEYKFALTHIYIVEYVGLTPGYEREIFQRVQLGMTLTAAGKFVECFIIGEIFTISIQRNCRPFPLRGLSKLGDFLLPISLSLTMAKVDYPIRSSACRCGWGTLRCARMGY